MNAIMPCPHLNLHVEVRNFAVGKKQSSGSFMVCSNTNCNHVVAYIPPPTKAPSKPTVNLQPQVKTLQKKIADLEALLVKCRNGQG